MTPGWCRSPGPAGAQRRSSGSSRSRISRGQRTCSGRCTSESGGGDGYVSLEVNPYLAQDTEGTLAAGQAIWQRVDRPNLMIKIPATKAGLPAITAAIAAGINVNVTLIFSHERYASVMDAYLKGSGEARRRGPAGRAPSPRWRRSSSRAWTPR